jgi:hypothetical protein
MGLCQTKTLNYIWKIISECIPHCRRRCLNFGFYKREELLDHLRDHQLLEKSYFPLSYLGVCRLSTELHKSYYLAVSTVLVWVEGVKN